ncbi:MAG: septum formation initiator family protein [Deltaproteobacteria bacterium]|nr:septum formation initiator family protein [Deltaproteobacteria bacterium]
MLSPRSSLWLRIFSVVNGALVVGLVSAGLFGPNGVVRHEKLEGELQDIEELNRQLRAETAQLHAERDALSKEGRYLESVIREELGYVAADEMVFLFDKNPGVPMTALATP